jgi:hypothetical protein
MEMGRTNGFGPKESRRSSPVTLKIEWAKDAAGELTRTPEILYIARHTTEDDYAFTDASATGTSDFYVIIDQDPELTQGPFGTEEEAEQAAWGVMADAFDELFYMHEDQDCIFAADMLEGEFLTTGEGYDWFQINEGFEDYDGKEANYSEVASKRMEQLGFFDEPTHVKIYGKWHWVICREVEHWGIDAEDAPEFVYRTMKFTSIKAMERWLREQTI